MKAIGRRIRKLDEQAKPVVNECGETLVDVLRARRRRRLEAAGQPFDDRPTETFVSGLPYGEALRLELQRRREKKNERC